MEFAMTLAKSPTERAVNASDRPLSPSNRVGCSKNTECAVSAVPAPDTVQPPMVRKALAHGNRSDTRLELSFGLSQIAPPA